MILVDDLSRYGSAGQWRHCNDRYGYRMYGLGFWTLFLNPGGFWHVSANED